MISGHHNVKNIAHAYRKPRPKTEMRMIFCDLGIGRLLIKGNGSSAVAKSVIALTAAVEYLNLLSARL